MAVDRFFYWSICEVRFLFMYEWDALGRELIKQGGQAAASGFNWSANDKIGSSVKAADSKGVTQLAALQPAGNWVDVVTVLGITLVIIAVATKAKNDSTLEGSLEGASRGNFLEDPGRRLETN